MITEHTTAVPGLAIVRSTRGWARLLHRYVVDHGGAVVKTRPLEERQAIEDEYDVLIVDDISSFLSAYIVEELHRRGRRVLGVYDQDEFSPNGDTGAGKQRLERLGVDGVIDAEATPEDFVRVIRDLAPVRAIDYSNGAFGAGELGDDPFGHLTNSHSPGAVIRPMNGTPDNRPRGHITTVLGTSGGVGASEIALELARALGKRGERAVVIDADEMVPSLAQRLGVQLHPNIRTAVDVVEHGTGRLIDCLTNVGPNLEALVGLPHPRDWVEIRGPEIEAVIREVSRGRHQVVVNASPNIEDLAPFGSADRFAASRAAVSLADSIVLVCPPTPMGIARLIDRVADLDEIAQDTAVHVIINRAPKNSGKRKEIAREIERNFRPNSLHFISNDNRVEAAAWDGVLVSSGEFTRIVDDALAPLIPQQMRAARRSSKQGSTKQGSAQQRSAQQRSSKSRSRNQKPQTAKHSRNQNHRRGA